MRRRWSTAKLRAARPFLPCLVPNPDFTTLSPLGGDLVQAKEQMHELAELRRQLAESNKVRGRGAGNLACSRF